MTFFTNSYPKARKEHRCGTCYRMISVGETYRKCAGLDGGTAWTFKECNHCGVVGRAMCQNWGMDEYDISTFQDWDPADLQELRVKVHFNKRWRRADGSLYPVPSLETVKVAWFGRTITENRLRTAV